MKYPIEMRLNLFPQIVICIEDTNQGAHAHFYWRHDLMLPMNRDLCSYSPTAQENFLHILSRTLLPLPSLERLPYWKMTQGFRATTRLDSRILRAPMLSKDTCKQAPNKALEWLGSGRLRP